MATTLPRVLALSEWMWQLRDLWKDHFEVVGPGKGDDPLAWLQENGRGITAMWAVGHDPLGAAELDRLPDLKRVVVMSAGMDGMDIQEMARRELVVSTTSEINDDEVADHAMAMMLALRRGLFENHSWVRENRWIDEGRAPMTRSMANTRVGIAGLGWIGQAIARRTVPFKSEIAWWGPRDKPGVAWPRYDSLVELARWCDVLMVAVRAHDDTRGLITREVIEAVGPDGTLINITRGFVVDEDALIAALKDGRLGQAGLDVFEPEPTSAARWEGVPNVLLQPHVAGATTDSIQRVIQHSVDQLRSYPGELMATFILIHGGAHGGWCWDQLVPELEKRGHRALAPDLPGMADSPLPISAATMPNWAKFVTDLARAQGEKVVLVGHSRGGPVIGEAAELAPELFLGLVYLTALLLPAGKTTMDAFDDPQPRLMEGATQTPDGAAVIFNGEAARAAFYHRAPKALSDAAIVRLCPDPIAPSITPMTVTEERWGSLPRAFIECSDDQIMPLALQRRLHAALPCHPVVTIDSDHSPFLWKPAEVAEHLDNIAANFAVRGKQEA